MGQAEGYKAVIFDADGVLIQAPKLFSRVYTERRGFDSDRLEPFFRGEFQDALCGRADLTKLLANSPLWDFKGDPKTLISEWLTSENHPNHHLIALIRRLRTAGTPVFLATSQEPNRADFLRKVMFPHLFDEMFISCEIGSTKNAPEFWEAVLTGVAKHVPGIEPGNIVFFDDSPSHLHAAELAGIHSYLYRNVDQVEEDLIVPVPH